MKQAARGGRRALCGVLWLLTVPGWAGPAAAADDYWQVQQGQVTVVAASSRELAALTAARVLQVQNAARWLFAWPADFQPPPTLVFALNTQLVRDTFERPVPSAATDVGPMAVRGQTLVTPQLTLVMAPLGVERGRELETLQYLYGQALTHEAPTAAWSECPRQGFGMLFAAAEFSGDNHLYVAGAKVRGYRMMRPEEFLGAERSDPATQQELDRRGYACYLLSRLMATGTPDLRRAYAGFLTALGSGVPLERAIPAELGGSLPEFSKRYLQFADRISFNPREADIRVELPDRLPAAGAPVPVAPARMQMLLGQLCSKLGPCRADAH